jgi:hypothetical protein
MHINKFLSFFIKFLHTIITLIVFAGPYITNNIFYLSCFIFCYIFIVTLWYLFGQCFITIIENILDGNKDSNNSFVVNEFSLLFGSYTKIIFGLFPLINTMVCLYKINLKC